MKLQWVALLPGVLTPVATKNSICDYYRKHKLPKVGIRIICDCQREKVSCNSLFINTGNAQVSYDYY